MKPGDLIAGLLVAAAAPATVASPADRPYWIPSRAAFNVSNVLLAANRAANISAGTTDVQLTVVSCTANGTNCSARNQTALRVLTLPSSPCVKYSLRNQSTAAITKNSSALRIIKEPCPCNGTKLGAKQSPARPTFIGSIAPALAPSAAAAFSSQLAAVSQAAKTPSAGITGSAVISQGDARPASTVVLAISFSAVLFAAAMA